MSCFHDPVILPWDVDLYRLQGWLAGGIYFFLAAGFLATTVFAATVLLATAFLTAGFLATTAFVSAVFVTSNLLAD